jgi:hypothetical protein
MGFQISPGVAVAEVDLTTVVPSVASTIGAYAGAFNWGPIGLPLLIPDENNLVFFFGKPDANTFQSWFTPANFLAYSSTLRVTRVGSALHKNATSNGNGVLIKNPDTYTNQFSTGGNAEGPWAARWAGAVGNSLKVSLCSGANSFSSNLTSQQALTANVSNVSNIVTFSGNVNPFLVVGDFLKIGTNPYIQVASVGSNLVSLISNPTTTLTGAVAVRKWEFADKFLSAPGTSASALAVGGANDECHLIVTDEDGKFTGVPKTVLEKYQFMSKAFDTKNDDGSSNYYVQRLINDSDFIWWIAHPGAGANWGNTAQFTTFTDIYRPITVSMTGGVDGTPTDGEITSTYDLYGNPDTIDVSLIMTGPASATVAAYVINNVGELRKDCVVFVSPLFVNVVGNSPNELNDVTTFRNLMPVSSYAVMDNNWKYQFDKYNNTYRWVPLNGDIAGLCAQTDTTNDPWFSPGGFNRGQIKNVVKLAWNAARADRDNLYNISINPIVSFPGEGTILYGDKTLLAKPSAFDRINIRRLFIILEKSISQAAKFSLFEFNDSFTRAQFVSLVEPFLRTVQGRRGITDFRVVCDESNNTGDVIDLNQFVGDIYIKPARSINFIQLNFVATATGVDFSEIVGKF